MRRVVRRRLFGLGIAVATLLFLLTAARPARATEVRVVTFNVAMDLFFVKPFAGLIRGTFTNNEHLVRFDVIGLQEACANDRYSIELFRGLMKRTYGKVYEHVVLADPKSRESCRKAQVILSRYPIVRSGGLTLPKVGAHRSAAWVDLQIGSETLRVYCLHLSNRKGKDFTPMDGRWTQGKVVLDHWLAEKRENPGARGIVLGDFNAMGDLWRPGRRELTLQKYWERMTPNLNRFIPTMFLPYQTDWIFSSGLTLRRSYVVPTIYSDHYVVMADYSL